MRRGGTALHASVIGVPEASRYDQRNSIISTAVPRPPSAALPSPPLRRMRSATAVAGPPTTPDANAALSMDCKMRSLADALGVADLISTAISAVVTTHTARTVMSHTRPRGIREHRFTNIPRYFDL